jgi:Heavy metal associated domain 2
MEMGIAGIKVVHTMPGRVRVKISRLKNNPAFAREIQERLSGIPGIQTVEVSLLTGSVLVLYDAEEMDPFDSLISLGGALTSLFPELNLDDLQAWFDSGGGGTNGQIPVTERLTSLFGALNQEVGKATGSIDLKLLLPLSLFILGVRGLFVAEKAAFPAWYDLLWFAFGTFFMLNPQGTEPRR